MGDWEGVEIGAQAGQGDSQSREAPRKACGNIRIPRQLLKLEAARRNSARAERERVRARAGVGNTQELWLGWPDLEGKCLGLGAKVRGMQEALLSGCHE